MTWRLTAASVFRPTAIPAAFLAAVTLPVTVSPAGAHSEPHGAHVHGLARLAVTLDGELLSLALESPLDNLLGFEHHPRTDEQKEAVARMLATLNAPADLFAPTAAADCVPVRVAIESPLLAPAGAAHHHSHAHDHARARDHEHHHEPDHVHADLYAEFDFECAEVGALRGVTVELFDAFPRLERINAELAVPGGQAAARLDARQRELSWR